MSYIVACLTKKVRQETFRPDDLQKRCKAWFIQRRSFQDKVHRQYSHGQEGKAGSGSGYRFFPKCYIRPSGKNGRCSGKIRYQFIQISGNIVSVHTCLHKGMIQENPASAALFTVGKDHIFTVKILKGKDSLGIILKNIKTYRKMVQAYKGQRDSGNKAGSFFWLHTYSSCMNLSKIQGI